MLCRSWSTNSSNREQHNDNIDVEAVALGKTLYACSLLDLCDVCVCVGNSVVNNPIQSKTRNNGNLKCAIRFGRDTQFTLDVDSGEFLLK